VDRLAFSEWFLTCEEWQGFRGGPCAGQVARYMRRGESVGVKWRAMIQFEISPTQRSRGRNFELKRGGSILLPTDSP
jgi:hypothetical protein